MTRRTGGALRGAAGSQTLEAAMAVPVLALVLLAAFQSVAVAADAALATEAARRAVRVAVTTTDDAAVQGMVAQVVGDRPVEVTVTQGRRPGTDVTVDVGLTSRLGPLRPRVTGSATARGEPALGS